jgi:two-component system, cell cycle sensor histidine kinase and response regulator CckA
MSATKLPSSKAENREKVDFLTGVLAQAGNLGVYRTGAEPDTSHMALWSRGMEALTGYSLDEVERRGWIQALFVDPLVREQIQARLAQVVGGQPVVEEEWEICRADDERRMVRFSMSGLDRVSVHCDVLLQMTDVTALHRQHRESRQQSARFLEDIIESIQDGVSVLDTELNIVHVNGVMRRWYEENLPLVGKKCYECYHNRPEPCGACPTLRALESGQTEHEVVSGLPGTSVDVVELFSFPILDRSTGEVTGVVEFVRDITEKRRLEAKLLQAQKMEAIGTLASGIAHDFNNILTGVLASTDLMLADLDPADKFVEELQIIGEHVESATGLTGQLLGLARGGKHEPQLTCPNALVGRTLDLFARSRKEIVVHRQLPEEVWSVVCDRGQIEQVLLNVLVNAWQAMAQRHEVFVETENVVIGPHDAVPECEPGQYVKITVTDTGVGMDKDVLERIFDPFFTTKARTRGTGLGLASAYGIVRNHGGVIHVYSEPGEGSTFAIYLPASEDAAVVDQPVFESKRTGEGTVLLVDDEAPVRRGAEKLLQRLGYEVLTASSGAQALALYQVERARIDLVILDLVMPGISGPQLFEELKKIDPEVKTLLSSGYSVNGEAAALLEQGCDGFLPKPYRLDALGLKIAEILGST